MRHTIDRRGIRKLARDPDLREAMLHHAERAYAFAYGIAPSDSGEYRRRMFARKANNAWASAYYGSESYKGWWVEFGTVNHAGHRTLQHAARLAGMRVAQVAKPGAGGGL